MLAGNRVKVEWVAKNKKIIALNEEKERRRRRRRRGETETGRREGENRKLQGSKGFSGHWWIPANALEEESGS